ncbi:succinylglutamate desuccinylase/aspartoacylase family protein [Nguyenibacter sp. L1]|uniref:succinylglutamate desuccinylase/aspartoacylase family protein n=1 Tax=Nguyenibacter sp. L1 TaxID=3049350 RepID=UPI002B49F45D|nr:succinylglutamate desuccinylase/aspartoacylase family protein [Nguyenibacter sp. L1]WRH87782.1 M14 family metallopeptidase [Nguyenibacter sp. L1]
MTFPADTPPPATGEPSAAATRQLYPLPPDAAGHVHTVTAFRYGTPGARPKAHLQAGLHADEFPGMLALYFLRRLLDEAAARGRLRGEILILPQANPIGLTQWRQGFLLGRAETASGGNFNRGYPDLAALASRILAGRLDGDAAANVARIRAAMAEALAAMRPATALDGLRHRLLTLAHDADLVLDLHADNQAQRHMYVGTPLWPQMRDIAAEIDARAVLLADISGGNPFDEACSLPWQDLARRFPDAAIPPACAAATLELGSNDDVDLGMAQDQAAALYRILERRGLIDRPDAPAPLPRLSCDATPLAAMQQVKAPIAGLVAYRARLGDQVRTGDVVATVIDPLGQSIDVLAATDGLFFARHSQTCAWPGKIIGKIAGKIPLADRTGHLLTD